jgi:DNA-binding NarL/FixJ family response regulator
VNRPPPGVEIEIVEIDGEARPNLTQAESELLRALAAGHPNAQIASARRTSKRTVANQVQALMRKFNVQSRHQLEAKGARAG